MQLNKATIELVKKYEGLELVAYKCPAGILTIGYGRTGPSVKPGLKITKEQAEKWLIEDLERAATAVRKLVKVPLNDNQFGALVSFTFNLGAQRLKGSTLLKLLNQQKYDLAAEEFPKWCKANGKTLKGLLNRRLEEKALFKGSK